MRRSFALQLFACAVLVAATVPHAQSRRTAGGPPPVPAGFDVVERSIEDLQRAMTAREVTARQLVEAYLARIEAYDRRGPGLNAIVAVNPQARSAADALDAERAAGRVRGPLHGVPVVVKDNYETIEMPTSAGSIALAGFHPPQDATLVQRLKAAGAVILAKTTMHELAAGITTVGSRFGQTRNPYDLDRNPGGSSGGTGAAVAANFAAGGMGSDTCGSIRNPASHNNLVGLRGTQGLSSRAGIVPLSSSQDIGGPITRTMTDLAIMLDATVGPDAADAQTTRVPRPDRTSYQASLAGATLAGMRLGVVRGLFGSSPEDQEVTTIVNRALEAIRKAGAEVEDVVVPGLDELLRDSSLINADFKFDLAEYLARHPAAPVKSLGEILDRGLYHRALESTFRARNGVERRDSDQARRARIKQAGLRRTLEAVLAEHQLAALVYPTLRRRPARIGDAQAGSTCQVSAHSGLPALALPAGFTDDDVPVGMDLLGGAFGEVPLLRIGLAVERTLNLRRLPFSTPRLVTGAAPPPHVQTMALPALDAPGARTVAAVRFTYDPTRSELEYALTAPAAALARIAGLWVHGGTVAQPGAGRHEIYGSGQPAAGRIVLTALDRRDLAAEGLVLRLFLHDRAGSAADLALRVNR